MRIVLFGASGMIGQGVLRECLLAPNVDEVVAVVRRPLAETHPKVRQVVCEDMGDLSPIAAQLTGCDACFYCLGVSSAGIREEAYRKVTFDFTLAAARTLVAANPSMTFIYVSGAGTDGTARGRAMWARVKGETENALLALPFASALMFRPGFIMPLHGIVSRTPLYRGLYAVLGPLYPALRAVVPGAVTTTENVGRAMVRAASTPRASGVLETRDINALATAPS